MKKHIVLVVCLLVRMVRLFAAEDLSMIVGPAQLCSYALEQARRVSASAYSGIAPDSAASATLPVVDNHQIEIERLIGQLTVRPNVPNPNDEIFLDGYVSDERGYPLFEAHKTFHTKKSADGQTWVFPPGAGRLGEMKMASTIRIPVSGAQYALFYPIGSDGKSLSPLNIQVWEGYVFFPSDWAGKNAILAIYRDNQPSPDIPTSSGGWQFWKVKTGKYIPYTGGTITPSAEIARVKSYKDRLVLLITSITNGVGVTPLVEYTATTPQQAEFTFYAGEKTTSDTWNTTPQESGSFYFTGVMVRKSGETEWKAYTNIVTSHQPMPQILIDLTPGTYYVVPIWPEGKFHEIETPYYSPFLPDGGKG